MMGLESLRGYRFGIYDVFEGFYIIGIWDWSDEEFEEEIKRYRKSK